MEPPPPVVPDAGTPYAKVSTGLAVLIVLRHVWEVMLHAWN